MATVNSLSLVEFENELLASAISTMTGVEVVTSKNFQKRKDEEIAKGNRVVSCPLDIGTFFKFTYNTLRVEDHVYSQTGIMLPASSAPLRVGQHIGGPTLPKKPLSSLHSVPINYINISFSCIPASLFKSVAVPSPLFKSVAVPSPLFKSVAVPSSLFKSVAVPSNCTVLELKRRIESIHPYLQADNIALINGTKTLDDTRLLSDYGITNSSHLVIVPRIRGCGDSVYILKLDDSCRDPQYDYDFTSIKDSSSYIRGGKPYYRPCGWKRIAIKVLGKYKNDKWLTNGKKDQYGDWPVSYHGTAQNSAIGIAGGAYRTDKTKNGRAYGDGVYSSPELDLPIRYTVPFVHDGKTYKVILQNRINLKKTKVFKDAHGDIYVTPDSNNIRPYGLIYKQV